MTNKSVIQNDIVLTSRVRLARNLNQFPFKLKINDEQQELLIKVVKSALEKINDETNPFIFISLADIGKIQAYALMEQHLISPDLIKNSKHGFVALTKDKNICIMVNEEDHIRIQAITDNLNLEKALDAANAIDDALDKHLDYAFDDNLGFLTSCPTNLGTGLRASVMLHLPALAKAGIMSNLMNAVRKLGLTIRGSYGEGSNVIGSMYILSNQITLGISEIQSVTNLESIVQEIITQEKNARNKLAEDKENFEDVIFRSLGVLQNARVLSSDEYYKLISNIMLGIGEEYITDIDIDTIRMLQRDIGSAVICEKANQNLSPHQRDVARAKLVRNVLTKK